MAVTQKGSKFGMFSRSVPTKSNHPTFLIVAAVILALLMIFRPFIRFDICSSGASDPKSFPYGPPRNTQEVDKFLRFLKDLNNGARIGLVNMRANELEAWGIKTKNTTIVPFELISSNISWHSLFPGWMDELAESPCPDIPLPKFPLYNKMDYVIAKLPCQRPKIGWNRDVFRLQVHLVAGNLAVQKGQRNERGKVKVIFLSKCEPMKDIFRCDDLVGNLVGSWWVYEIDASRLEEKMKLSPGSCKLVAPLRRDGNTIEMDVRGLATRNINHREAYVTVLHSSDSYVCGAITLAHSIRKTGSTRDLILLHDDSIGLEKLRALMKAGWSLRQIKRIRNPHPRPDGLFEYNYSKLRVFQLTDYDKVILIDTDTIVVRNLDILFRFPSITARSDHGFIFNSGILVLEPSSCLFNTMMMHIESVKSYNGGDQGFLNEMFVWWHRLSQRTNIFKQVLIPSNETIDSLLNLDPPQFYAIHYFGLKPWLCYRDYDCNYDLESVRRYVSEAAHQWWWRLYDEIDEDLKMTCKLSVEQKNKLEWFRQDAEKKGFPDGHWRINITDPRKDQ